MYTVPTILTIINFVFCIYVFCESFNVKKMITPLNNIN
jgi:hypothetical protein